MHASKTYARGSSSVYRIRVARTLNLEAAIGDLPRECQLKIGGALMVGESSVLPASSGAKGVPSMLREAELQEVIYRSAPIGVAGWGQCDAMLPEPPRSHRAAFCGGATLSGTTKAGAPRPRGDVAQPNEWHRIPGRRQVCSFRLYRRRWSDPVMAARPIRSVAAAAAARPGRGGRRNAAGSA